MLFIRGTVRTFLIGNDLDYGAIYTITNDTKIQAIKAGRTLDDFKADWVIECPFSTSWYDSLGQASSNLAHSCRV